MLWIWGRLAFVTQVQFFIWDVETVPLMDMAVLFWLLFFIISLQARWGSLMLSPSQCSTLRRPDVFSSGSQLTQLTSAPFLLAGLIWVSCAVGLCTLPQKFQLTNDLMHAIQHQPLNLFSKCTLQLGARRIIIVTSGKHHHNIVRFLPDTCFCAMENKKKLEMCIAAYGLERWYGKTQGAPCI